MVTTTVRELPDLTRFKGSDHVFRCPMNPRVAFTEGVQFLADATQAHWLIDRIAIYQRDPLFDGIWQQVWRLTVEGSKARLVCEDGNDKPLFEEPPITYTDFPPPGIDLWLIGGVLMLPSEY